jgi:hypothetical protein
MFEWRGFSCAVTSPDFHVFDNTTFSVASIDDNDAPPDVKMISTIELAKILAHNEDEGNKKRSLDHVKENA